MTPEATNAGPSATDGANSSSHATATGGWLLGAAVVCWGCTPRVTAVAAPFAEPLIITTLRAVPAALLLLAAVGAFGRRLPRGSSQWTGTAVSGVLMVTVFLAAFTEGVVRAGPAPAIVLGSTSPFFVATAEWALFGARVSLRTIGGIVVGFAGVVLIVAAQAGSSNGHGDTLSGLVLALVAAAAWAAGTIVVGRLLEREPDIDMLGLTAGQYLVGGALLLAISLATSGDGDVVWNAPRLWWALAFVSIVGSALATLAYLSALRVIDATRASTWLFIAPVIAVLLDGALGDRPDAVVLVGMALTIAGVAVVALPAGGEAQRVRPDTSLERRSPS